MKIRIIKENSEEAMNKLSNRPGDDQPLETGVEPDRSTWRAVYLTDGSSVWFYGGEGLTAVSGKDNGKKTLERVNKFEKAAEKEGVLAYSEKYPADRIDPNVEARKYGKQNVGTPPSPYNEDF